MTPAAMLTAWVKAKHQGQVKKYTGKPYFTHLADVAAMADGATAFGYETGLCHDLLEDTGTSEKELFDSLVKFGYEDEKAHYITNCVVELSDKFTSAAYPELSRELRKEKEAIRLQTISPGAQTVKYCDLIDNMKIVVQHEPEYTEQYLKKKKLLITGMVNGNAQLRLQALQMIEGWLAT